MLPWFIFQQGKNLASRGIFVFLGKLFNRIWVAHQTCQSALNTMELFWFFCQNICLFCLKMCLFYIISNLSFLGWLRRFSYWFPHLRSISCFSPPTGCWWAGIMILFIEQALLFRLMKERCHWDRQAMALPPTVPLPPPRMLPRRAMALPPIRPGLPIWCSPAHPRINCYRDRCCNY